MADGKEKQEKQVEAKPDDGALRSLSQVAKIVGLPPMTVVQATREGFVTVDTKHRYHVGQAIRDLFRYFLDLCMRLPVYENMHRCHAATGIPLSVIKSAKRGATKLGTASRIDLGALLKEIFAESKEQDWRALREKREALR